MPFKQQKLLLKDKLKNIKNKTHHKQIFNILLDDINFKYSTNNNGLYFDINKINIDTINNINELLETVEETNDNKLEFTTYINDKLEKNLIKLNINI